MIPVTAAALALLVVVASESVDEVVLMQAHVQLRPAAHSLGSQVELLRQAAIHLSQWPRPGDADCPVQEQQRENLQMLKEHPEDLQLVNSSITGLATTATWFLVQEGGFDVLFDALERFPDVPSLQMNTFRGISDQSHTEQGAPLIADHGGPGRGIRFMVQQMKRYPEPHAVEQADHLTIKYEILQCISGVLEHDSTGTWGEAAVEEGLLEQVVFTMRVEPDLRPTQHVACQVMLPLLQRHPEFGPRFRELGGVPLVTAAIDNFSSYDPTPFYFGSTYGDCYPVVPMCKAVLEIVG